LANALKTYAGVTTDPTFNEYGAYLGINALVQGLKAAGKNPTQAKFINTILGIHNYAAAGLWGGRTISFALQGRGEFSGADNCVWLTQYVGTKFHLVPGLDPVCGTTLKGRSVSSDS
jgi:branched-chain amino acid transport system substrate-binding protein